MNYLQDVNQYQLGSITYFYETGKRNINEAVGIISSGSHDPGGKSYGIYQLASSTGMLSQFIAFYQIKASQYFTDVTLIKIFDHVQIATNMFDEKWHWLAINNSLTFAKIQHAFIAQTLFDPLIKYLTDQNISKEHITLAIKEAIWSLGVQHGKALLILQQSYADHKNLKEEINFVKCLYRNRANYINQLSTLHESMKKNICIRYEKECAEIINKLIKNI